MKHFKFRLDSLLKFREINVKRSLEAYSLALAKMNELEAISKSMHEAIAMFNDSARQKREQVFSISEHSYFEKSNEVLRFNIKEIENKKLELKSELALLYEDYLGKKQNLDLLLKLRDQKKKEHMQEMNRIEELEVGDMINARYGRES